MCVWRQRRAGRHNDDSRIWSVVKINLSPQNETCLSHALSLSHVSSYALQSLDLMERAHTSLFITRMYSLSLFYDLFVCVCLCIYFRLRFFTRVKELRLHVMRYILYTSITSFLCAIDMCIKLTSSFSREIHITEWHARTRKQVANYLPKCVIKLCLTPRTVHLSRSSGFGLWFGNSEISPTLVYVYIYTNANITSSTGGCVALNYDCAGA